MEPSTYSEDRDHRVVAEQAAFFELFDREHTAMQTIVDLEPSDADRLRAMFDAIPRLDDYGKPYLNRYDAETGVVSAMDVHGGTHWKRGTNASSSGEWNRDGS